MKHIKNFDEHKKTSSELRKFEDYDPCGGGGCGINSPYEENDSSSLTDKASKINYIIKYGHREVDGFRRKWTFSDLVNLSDEHIDALCKMCDTPEQRSASRIDNFWNSPLLFNGYTSDPVEKEFFKQKYGRDR